MKTVFVAGIHGVGKSYVCDTVCNRLNLPHYSSSALIKEYSNQLVSKDKAVRDISINQDVLVIQYRKLDSAKLILMDGHTCLLKDGERVERVPISTFEKLDICAFILVTAPVSVVYERMITRDGVQHNQRILTELLADEQQYCSEIAAHLSVPQITIESNDSGINSVISFVSCFL